MGCMLETTKQIDAEIPILRVLIGFSSLSLWGTCFMHDSNVQEERLFGV